MYLAKETIAILIDLVFTLRQDKMALPGDPFSKAYVLNAHSDLHRETYGNSSKVFFVLFEFSFVGRFV